jgi:hypothetical protein
VKKATLLSLATASFLSATSITVYNGWNVYGHTAELDLNKTFSKHTDISLVWSFKNETKEWEIFANTDGYREIAEEKGYENLESLPKSAGFWVLNEGNTTEIELVEKNQTVSGNGRAFLNVERVFTKSGSSVTDSVSGLIWADSAKIVTRTYDSINYCSNLELDGISDWRVPTIKELVYLQNASVLDKFSSTSTEYRYISTSVIYDYGLLKYWTVSFSTGYTDLVKDDYYELTTLCVSGKSNYDEIELVRERGVKVDLTHNLEWQDSNLSSGRFQPSHSSAFFYCENLTHAGKTDWRLPTTEELYSITNDDNIYDRYDYYWTSKSTLIVSLFGEIESSSSVYNGANTICIRDLD